MRLPGSVTSLAPVPFRPFLVIESGYDMGRGFKRLVESLCRYVFVASFAYIGANI